MSRSLGHLFFVCGTVHLRDAGIDYDRTIVGASIARPKYINAPREAERLPYIRFPVILNAVKNLSNYYTQASPWLPQRRELAAVRLTEGVNLTNASQIPQLSILNCSFL